MCTVTNSVSMSKIAISTMVTETVIFLQFTDDIFIFLIIKIVVSLQLFY